MTAPLSHGSIRQRLLALLLISAAVIGLFLYLVVQSVARQIAQESQDNILAASAISILDSARVVGGEVFVDLPYSALSMLDSVTDERAFYAVRVDDAFLSGYEDLPRPSGFGESDTAFLSAAYLGEAIRLAATRRSFSTDEGRVFLEISVAQTLTGLLLTQARISRISVWIGIGFFVLSACLALFVARSTIQPLDRLTGSVSRRGPGDLRPVAAPVPSEMVPLVSSLNTLMSRLQTSLSQSEDFIAEAAHRVRTPLAIVRTEAESTLRRVEKAENRASVREMIRAIDESSRAAGQLLDHAMVTFRADSLADDLIDLRSVAEETVERLQPLSELNEVDVHLTAPSEAVIRGDAILLQNALHNVLDNAIKYAGRDSVIDVALDCDPTTATLTVNDTGPGFPEAMIGNLVKRFARGSNADGVVGSGLGLTIVDAVVQAHGGQLDIMNVEGAGGCVRLSFPLA